MTRERRPDWISLLAGLLLLALGAAFVLNGTGYLGFNALWALPVLLVGLTGIAFARSIARNRGPRDRSGR